MTTVPVPELPAALVDLPIARIEELERETGEGFGAMIDELAGGNWSVTTMRRLLLLVEPDRTLDTMGDLMAAATEIMGKASEGKPS